MRVLSVAGREGATSPGHLYPLDKQKQMKSRLRERIGFRSQIEPRHKKNLFLPYLYLEILPRVTREQKNTRHVTHAKAVHAGIAFTPQTCFCKAFFSI